MTNMFDKISGIIKDKKLAAADCEYHTLRTLDNNGKVRALLVKGENIVHLEMICPKCGTYSYTTQEKRSISKAAKIRYVIECPKCNNKVKIDKLKGKK